MATVDRISNFTKAMKRIYHFTLSSTPQTPIAQWKPPPASAGHKGRYLWTDAFGVLNFLALHRRTGSAVYLTYAATLARCVHDILGRTRDGGARLPVATDKHPLGGGLRIGKEGESGPDGDGQYHHYLTLWMFALNRLSIAAGERQWNDQAVALMKAVHPRFVYDRERDRPRMYWKMSMDLRTPLVRSEGNLDPMDGLVICKLLQEADGQGSQVLREELRDYEKIVKTKWRGYSSDDPLDLGMTLWISHWYAGKEEWATGLLTRAARDLREVIDSGYFEASPARRLAFREFGTCLGIRCALQGAEWDLEAERIAISWEKTGVVPDPEAGKDGSNTMDDLQPITLVMYAAALDPGVFENTWQD